MAIRVPGEFHEKSGTGSDGCAWQFGDLPENHRASGYALETRGMAIAVSDELHEREGPGTNRALAALCGSSVAGRRASC